MKKGGEGVDEPTRHHRRLEVQGKQWIWPLQLETGSISSGKHTERPQFAVCQDPDVVFTDTPTELLGHRLGDLLVTATAVGVLGDEVEQPRKLKHLAVGAAGEVGSFFESRIPVLAEQLDPLGEPRRPGFSVR